MAEDEAASFEASARLQLLLLRASGLLALRGRSLGSSATRLLALCSHLCESLFTASYVSSVVQAARDARFDVERVAETVGHCGGHSRYLLLYLSRGRIAGALRTSEDLWRGLGDPGARRVVAGFVDRSSWLLEVYGAACALMCLLYVLTSQLAPLLEAESAAGNGSSSSYRPLPYAFIVEVHGTPAYELTVLLQTVCILYACAITTGVDAAAPFLVMTACGHLQLLARALDGSESYADFVRCIKYHQRILRLCEQIDDLMSLVFLSGLMSTTYNMSLIGIKLIGDDPEKFKYLVVGAILMIQMFICQWAPGVLLNESKALANHAYRIPHVKCNDRKLGKLLHITLMKCQIPIQLRAANYVKLSMEGFGSMITSAISFFTVLSSFNQR